MIKSQRLSGEILMIAGKKLMTVMLLVLAVCPFVFADGVFADGGFVQSPMASEPISYTYASQLGIEAPVSNVPEESTLLAISNSEYPVTPGDVYQLIYSEGKNNVTIELFVDSDYRTIIPSIGIVNGRNQTFSALKKSVEELVSSYYPYSSPQLVLKSCGVFSVRVTGEVPYTQYVKAWGLSRLSDIAVFATPLASTRSVVVTYSDGSKQSYDLFSGLRKNSLKDDPLLKPGCEVFFPKASTIVSLNGAVRQPGVYQPVAGESLYKLVSEYGDGLQNYADSESISVARFVDGKYVVSNLTLEDTKSFIPENGDVFTVASVSRKLPYVTVTGAVAPSVEQIGKASVENKFAYSFVPGETAEQMMRNISGKLLPESDTDSVYLLRRNEKLSFDGTHALSSSEKGSLYLENGDTLVVPFKQEAFVTVTGEVSHPGTFAFVPDKDSDYYIRLAGGYTKNATQKVKVYDENGKTVSSSGLIKADSMIIANGNTFLQDLSTTASVLGIITSILVIVRYAVQMTQGNFGS